MKNNQRYVLLGVLFASQILPVAVLAAPAPYLTQEASMPTVAVEVDANAVLNTEATAGTKQSTDAVVFTRASVDLPIHSSTSAQVDVVTSGKEKQDTMMASTTEESSATIQTHAKSMMTSDTQVSAVSASNEAVTLSYRMPAKVLGIFSVTIPVRVTVGVDGKVHTSYPWYGFLAPVSESSVTLHSQTAVDSVLNKNDSAMTSGQNAEVTARTTFTTAEQVEILDSIHASVQADAKTLVRNS